jgi:hypothetical protein
MPNWYLNSMGWIVSFLRYAARRLFWTLRGPGRHNVIKKYPGGLKAHSALNAHLGERKLASPNLGGARTGLAVDDLHGYGIKLEIVGKSKE